MELEPVHLLVVLLIAIGYWLFFTKAGKKFMNGKTGFVQNLRDNGARKPNEPMPCEIVFVLDTTGSMSREIAKIKDNLKYLVEKLKELGSKEGGKDFTTVKVGFVQYTEPGHAQHLQNSVDLTTDIDQVLTAVGNCNAASPPGNDRAEDLRGGFDKALTFNWTGGKKAMKVMIAITDAPCHGSQFGTAVDNRKGDSDEMVKTLGKMCSYNISILLSTIADTKKEEVITKKMSDEFKKIYKNKGKFPAVAEFDLYRNLDNKAFLDNVFKGLKGIHDKARKR